MGKNIIFCADGTWNDPHQDENNDHSADPTNVYKLFLALSGELSAENLRDADEQEKVLADNGELTQIAKYLHGVGDSRNLIVKLMGGAFGAGVISRIVRGYTFISRNYLPGDNIHIIGFSRGAYTARALAGLICSLGVLRPELTADKEKAYRHGAQAWYRYRRSADRDEHFFSRLAEIAADLPGFITSGELDGSSFVLVDNIAAVGVWDTVGAMGIPDYDHGANDDSFRFADTLLSKKVKAGFHAVALDEQREVFSPTLWDEAANVTQQLFPGAHGDVGGGYPGIGNESGLSDGALDWMMKMLANAGAIFGKTAPAGDPSGVAHQPWSNSPWNTPVFPHGLRQFPAGMPVNCFVKERMKLDKVKADPGQPLQKYAPTNLPSGWQQG